MGGQFYRSGESKGFQFEKRNNGANEYRANDVYKNIQDRDNDLIIEDNTIYEIDRECYERLKRQKKRK